jgi:hypothetical protein
MGALAGYLESMWSANLNALATLAERAELEAERES